MRGLEHLNNKVEKVVDIGKGYVIFLMSNGDKIKHSGGSISWRYNNPGNLKFGDFAKANGALKAGSGGHAVFASYEDGQAAMKELLFGSDSKYIGLSLVKAIARYAPVSDPKAKNQPKKYSDFIAKEVGIKSTKILRDMTDAEQDDMLKAMVFYEGYKQGSTTYV